MIAQVSQRSAAQAQKQCSQLAARPAHAAGRGRSAFAVCKAGSGVASRSASWRLMRSPTPAAAPQQRRQPARLTRVAATSPESARGVQSTSKATVLEYLLLIQAKPNLAPEAVENMVNTVWSLQYMVPGVVCAAAGPVVGIDQFTPSYGSAMGFTHAVHFRLAGRPLLEAFTSCPQLASALHDTVEPLSSNYVQVVFEGSVAKTLEAVYWRGDDYATGVEHLLFLAPNEAAPEGADKFLRQLGGLAESSVAGGIQSSAGKVISSCGGLSCSHVLMTRFAEPSQVDQFMQTKPVQALADNDQQLPLRANASVTWHVFPPKEVDVGGISI